MSAYHNMLADGIKDEIAGLAAARRAEVELWAERIRTLVEIAGPDGWLSLALVAAEWTHENNATPSFPSPTPAEPR